MARVKRGKTARKRRKKVLEQTKGFRWGRKNKYKAAKEALMHSLSYSYRDRRAKKRKRREEWQIIINAACREEGISYSQFMAKLKENNIALDRRVLSKIAKEDKEAFQKIVEEVK